MSVLEQYIRHLAEDTNYTDTLSNVTPQELLELQATLDMLDEGRAAKEESRKIGDTVYIVSPEEQKQIAKMEREKQLKQLQAAVNRLLSLSRTPAAALSPVLGAGVGGYIGRRLAKGKEKTASTVLGALSGLGAGTAAGLALRPDVGVAVLEKLAKLLKGEKKNTNADNKEQAKPVMPTKAPQPPDFKPIIG